MLFEIRFTNDLHTKSASVLTIFKASCLGWKSPGGIIKFVWCFCWATLKSILDQDIWILDLFYFWNYNGYYKLSYFTLYCNFFFDWIELNLLSDFLTSLHKWCIKIVGCCLNILWRNSYFVHWNFEQNKWKKHFDSKNFINFNIIFSKWIENLTKIWCLLFHRIWIKVFIR